MKSLPKISEKRKDIIRFSVICILSIVFGCMVFIPAMLLNPTEMECYYMKGIGGVSHGDGTQKMMYSQEFVSRNGKIKKIELDIDKNGVEDGGFLNIFITDKKGNIIAEESIPYENVEDWAYTHIELNIDVKCLHKYYINVAFDKVDNVYPKMILNHGEEQIWEGKRLFCNGEYQEGMNLVWGIEYGDAMSLNQKVLVLVFSIAAMIVFWLKNKWKLWMKIIIVLSAFLMMPRYIVYYGESIIEGPKNWFSEGTLSSNCIILYLVMAGLFLFSQSPKWTLRLGSIMTGILYIADFFVLRFRGSTMKVWDIMSVGTAKEVAGNYSYKVSGEILVFTAFLLFAWSISYSFPVLNHRIQYRILIGIAGIIYCVGIYQMVIKDEFWDKLEGVYCSTAFSSEICYRKSGYLVSFLFQLRETRGIEPENYKRKEVESILSEVEGNGKTEERKPHIIIIVNESLADLAVLGDIMSEEPLAYMKSLKEDTVKGYINVSVLGGGTSNSEFEFLTGNSIMCLPDGIYPFNMINTKQESLIWSLREMGYETYAMHPASESNWNRKAAYPLLGFQNYFWIEEFENAKTTHFGVSDKETYQKVIEIYENRKAGERQFIYDMTIQNHGGYDNIDVDEVIENTYPTVSEYLSLVRCSDKDLEELIGYFRNQSEDVLICIFGDHQPVLEDEFYEDIFAGNGKSEQENLLNKYKTPFWIWANYDIEEQENIEISLNYLGGLLFETAGLPKSDYMQYVSEVGKEYPVLTVKGYKDEKGTFYTSEELPDKLKEYKMVQYYYVFDGGFDHNY